MNPIIQYLGLDVHKDSISIGIASSADEVRFYGKVGGKLADVDLPTSQSRFIASHLGRALKKAFKK